MLPSLLPERTGPRGMVLHPFLTIIVSFHIRHYHFGVHDVPPRQGHLKGGVGTLQIEFDGIVVDHPYPVFVEKVHQHPGRSLLYAKGPFKRPFYSLGRYGVPIMEFSIFHQLKGPFLSISRLLPRLRQPWDELRRISHIL